MDYERKCEEQAEQIRTLLRKVKTLENGGVIIRKDLLGLIPGNLYLIITDGRRIVGKLEFENRNFVAYKKRAGTLYYANKNNINVIKELSEKESESYLKSNFDMELKES